jgi:hypothetical protein
LPGFFERHGVGAFTSLSPSERTQAAGRNADVGRVDVPVHIEVGNIAVHALAHMIGQPAYRENIRGAVQGHAIVIIKTLASENFLGNGLEAWVIRLKAMPRRRKRRVSAHPSMITRTLG